MVEYLVYDAAGGSITINLTEASDTFNILWYDPKTGAEQAADMVNGGANRTLTSPFSGDSVLLLTGTSYLDTTTPNAPSNLMVVD